MWWRSLDKGCGRACSSVVPPCVGAACVLGWVSLKEFRFCRGTNTNVPAIEQLSRQSENTHSNKRLSKVKRRIAIN